MIYDITTNEYLSETKLKLIENKSDDAITIRGFHIATSANQCHDIALRGIEPLGDVLNNPYSELSRFLNDYALSFDIDKSMAIRNNFRYSLNEQPYKSISHLLKRKVSVFLFCNNIESYGVIHRFPEIMNEMVDKKVLPPAALKKWEKEKKVYKVSFEVPATYISQSYLQLYKLNIKEYLIKQINDLSKLDTTNSEIVFERIPKNFITNIDQVV